MAGQSATFPKILFLLSILYCFLHSGETNDPGTVPITVPWYESLPAVAMDYKVHIDPGKEDCYYQFVNPGATFYVSFQVSNLNTSLIVCLKSLMTSEICIEKKSNNFSFII